MLSCKLAIITMDTYKATNTINGKFYIGSTNNFEKRRSEHLCSQHNYPFQNALRKNPEAFIWETVSDDSNEPILEQALLDMYYGTEQCYNLNPVANRPPSQAGLPVSKETRDKQSRSRKGKKRSIDTKQKISVSMSGENNPMFGRTGSSHPSARRVGELNSNSKKVEVTYPDGMVKVFPCARAAGEALGCHKVSIQSHAKRNHTPTKGKLEGYSFRYLIP
jgi:group I intron endonuclease